MVNGMYDNSETICCNISPQLYILEKETFKRDLQLKEGLKSILGNIPTILKIVFCVYFPSNTFLGNIFLYRNHRMGLNGDI